MPPFIGPMTSGTFNPCNGDGAIGDTRDTADATTVEDLYLRQRHAHTVAAICRVSEVQDKDNPPITWSCNPGWQTVPRWPKANDGLAHPLYKESERGASVGIISSTYLLSRGLRALREQERHHSSAAHCNHNGPYFSGRIRRSPTLASRRVFLPHNQDFHEPIPGKTANARRV